MTHARNTSVPYVCNSPGTPIIHTCDSDGTFKQTSLSVASPVIHTINPTALDSAKSPVNCGSNVFCTVEATPSNGVNFAPPAGNC